MASERECTCIAPTSADDPYNEDCPIHGTPEPEIGDDLLYDDERGEMQGQERSDPPTNFLGIGSKLVQPAESVVERLKAHLERDDCRSRDWGEEGTDASCDIEDALALIESLEAEIERLKAQMRKWDTSRVREAEAKLAKAREGLRLLLNNLNALSGTRGHRLGCECGSTPDGEHTCGTLQQAIKKATQTLKEIADDE